MQEDRHGALNVHERLAYILGFVRKPITMAAAPLTVLFLLVVSANSYAQLSFPSAVSLAVSNSPRVKMAADDVRRAQAALSDSKDQFIPNFGVNGGVGRSYGITLNVPTIVTANTQSLVFSYAQRDYIRSARAGLQAANEALADVRAQVEEDAANTYLGWVAAHQRQQAIAEEHGYAVKLVDAVEARLAGGLDSQLDAKLAHRTELQIRLQQLYVDDELKSLREHLAQLTGIPSSVLTLDEASVPPRGSFTIRADQLNANKDAPNVLSAEANEKARFEQAFGDSRYAARPQVLFQAQYGRVSPINDVSAYYNLNGKYNTFEAGLVVVLPVFDRSRAARARETMADAMHAQHEVQNLRSIQTENWLGAQHALAELTTRAELMDVELGIVQDQLTAMLTEVNAKDGDVAGRPMTVKDEQNARIAVQQRRVDLIDATFQLQKATVSILRQAGTLDDWLASLPSH